MGIIKNTLAVDLSPVINARVTLLFMKFGLLSIYGDALFRAGRLRSNGPEKPSRFS